MNIDETVACMIDYLKILPEGTKLCSGALIGKFHFWENCDLRKMFEIQKKFCDEAWKNGFYLDYSLDYGKEIGLPFNCTFVLRKKKEEKEFDFLRWQIGIGSDSAQIVEIDLHKKIISYFNTPTKNDPDIRECSEDEWREIIKLVDSCKFSQWEDQYDSSAEFDDFNWNVELIQNGAVVKNSKGFHDVPDQWGIFDALQGTCRSLFDIKYTTPFPDKKIYRFITTVELDGVLELPKRWEIFSNISKGKRVKLIPEEGENFDKNIIRVDMPFTDGTKIGYIPKHYVALWIPRMNSGTFYTGWINHYSAGKKMIAVDVYEKSFLPMENITGIYFSEDGFYGTDIHFDISFLSRKIVCKKETNFRSGIFNTTTVSFSKEQWENIILPALRKCNFGGWHTVYSSPDTIDETQWQMTVYCGEKKFYFSGNDYPEEWDLWQQFIRLCFNLRDIRKDENEK